MVEGVECIQANLEFDSFLDPEFLRERQIPTVDRANLSDLLFVYVLDSQLFQFSAQTVKIHAEFAIF